MKSTNNCGKDPVKLLKKDKAELANPYYLYDDIVDYVMKATSTYNQVDIEECADKVIEEFVQKGINVEGSLLSYLCKMTRNKLYDKVKKDETTTNWDDTKRPRPDDDDDTNFNFDIVNEQADEGEEKKRILKNTKRRICRNMSFHLPKQQETLLKLRINKMLSNSEIALRTNNKIESVRVEISKAKITLRKVLSEDDFQILEKLLSNKYRKKTTPFRVLNHNSL